MELAGIDEGALFKKIGLPVEVPLVSVGDKLGDTLSV